MSRSGSRHGQVPGSHKGGNPWPGAVEGSDGSGAEAPRPQSAGRSPREAWPGRGHGSVRFVGGFGVGLAIGLMCHCFCVFHHAHGWLS